MFSKGFFLTVVKSRIVWWRVSFYHSTYRSSFSSLLYYCLISFLHVTSSCDSASNNILKFVQCLELLWWTFDGVIFQVYDSLVDDILINLAEYKALSEKKTILVTIQVVVLDSKDQDHKAQDLLSDLRSTLSATLLNILEMKITFDNSSNLASSSWVKSHLNTFSTFID